MTGPRPKSRDEVFTMFDSLGAVYDILNHILSFNCDRFWRQHMASLCIRSGEERVLDVCCGTGDSTAAFAGRMKGRGRVWGLDFSQSMLERMQKKMSAAPFGSRIKICRGDALNLPFAGDIFDIVTSTFGVRNLVDLPRGLAEMVRVLKPGGTVGILEFVRPDRLPAIARFYLKRIVPVVGRIVSRSPHNPYRYLADSIKEFASMGEFEEHLCTAGLKNVKCGLNRTKIAAFYTATKQ